MQLAYSTACDRNKAPILDVLRRFVGAGNRVLEVGSGTGQHVVHFARELPESFWQPTDTGEYLPSLRARLRAEAPANAATALELDVRMNPWPVARCDILFTANTLHFMSPECVVDFFRGVKQVLRDNGHLVIYGPFNYAGDYTSASNADFDQWLQSTDPLRGIRDFEWVAELAAARGLELLHDITMPANNRVLVWRKSTAS
ncbi:MAG: DUF938 domain-containing protein [Gammaproteobacteria bacterium]